MKDSADNNTLRVLVYEEDKMLIAQCLEKDIGAQGKDLDELIPRLLMTIGLEMSLMDKIPTAPQEFFGMWEHAETIMPTQSSDFPINIRRLAA